MVVVKRLDNHLTDVHNLKRACKVYKDALRHVILHDTEDIIDCEMFESEDSESSEEESLDIKAELRHTTKKGPRIHPSIFQNIYEDSDDPEDERISWANVVPVEDLGIRQEGDHSVSDDDKNWSDSDGGESGDGNCSRNDGVGHHGDEDCDSGNDGDGGCGVGHHEDGNGGHGDYDDGHFGDDNDDTCTSGKNEEDGEHSSFQESHDREPLRPGSTDETTTSLTVEENKQVLSNFKDWLRGADGGRKDNKVSSQCQRQIQLITEFINPGKPSIMSLMSRNVLRDYWLKEFEKLKNQEQSNPIWEHLINFMFTFRVNVLTCCPNFKLPKPNLLVFQIKKALEQGTS